MINELLKLKDERVNQDQGTSAARLLPCFCFCWAGAQGEVLISIDLQTVMRGFRASPWECCFSCYESLLKWLNRGQRWRKVEPPPSRASVGHQDNSFNLSVPGGLTCKLISLSPLAPARITFRASAGQAKAFYRSQGVKYC